MKKFPLDTMLLWKCLTASISSHILIKTFVGNKWCHAVHIWCMPYISLKYKNFTHETNSN